MSEEEKKTLQELELRLRELKKSIEKNKADTEYLEKNGKFFESMIKEMEDENTTCTICSDPMGEEFSTAKCGHFFCTPCADGWAAAKKNSVTCPICRMELDSKQPFIITSKKKKALDNQTLKQKILTSLRTNFGAKMAYVIYYLKYVLPESDPGSKVIIFSQWDEMLMLMHQCMEKEKINTLWCKGSAEMKQKSLDAFKYRDDCNVMLLSLINSASGTNLTHANTVIFMDPINELPSKARDMEKQAKNRVHRQGQTKEVKILHLLIKDTIEETIDALNKGVIEIEPLKKKYPKLSYIDENSCQSLGITPEAYVHAKLSFDYERKQTMPVSTNNNTNTSQPTQPIANLLPLPSSLLCTDEFPMLDLPSDDTRYVNRSSVNYRTYRNLLQRQLSIYGDMENYQDTTSSYLTHSETDSSEDNSSLGSEEEGSNLLVQSPTSPSFLYEDV